eukprot:CAMPEP_0206155172 /NCGR_PEP_ID=MMETSP1474-20131121/1931_1 /ASSEMBLY_ACC=CAM_ASM_001110 /TAXON_ID=97495 /ORGANISM="Imantonia sp., Strain RCC918" /LENGTH=92 /DNA_ID=CAMNT_0053553709 /DNA_START=263 /DNA_END=538 /DNA_ORIENTATION=+
MDAAHGPFPKPSRLGAAPGLRARARSRLVVLGRVQVLAGRARLLRAAERKAAERDKGKEDRGGEGPDLGLEEVGAGELEEGHPWAALARGSE